MAPAGLKDEFRNTTKGFVGVMTIDPNGKEKGVAVRPGSSIWLSEAEQILTANAPRRDEDNPFTNGQLALLTKASDIKNRRPIGDSAPEASTEAPAEEVAPPPPDAPATDGPTVEKDAEDNTAPPPEPAPSNAREAKDVAKKQAEAERAKQAAAQAKAGAVPAKASPTAPSQSGNPKPAPQEAAA